MAFELFYTSAPRGLKPQTSGFCTVAMTRGFPAPFVPRLEALSGYRPPHDGASIEAAPIAWSHWIVDAGGVERHVLSAVGPTAPDHTLRNNKFAHHLLLRADELIEAGPAWVIAQPGMMANEWIGEPRLIDAERALPAATAPTSDRCETWDAVCGDAGWAGVIANVVMIDPSKSCSIVYPVGTPVIKLVGEALALLPIHWRWRVTFTTYFMQPMAGTRCAWRFCLDGTEAASAARSGGGTLVDLCARNPCTHTGTFIDRARRGQATAPSGAATSSGGAQPQNARRAAAAVTTAATSAQPRRRSPQPPVEEPPVVFGVEYVPDHQAEVRKIILWIAGVAAGLLLLITCAGVLYWYSLRATATDEPAQQNSTDPAITTPAAPPNPNPNPNPSSSSSSSSVQLPDSGAEAEGLPLPQEEPPAQPTPESARVKITATTATTATTSTTSIAADGATEASGQTAPSTMPSDSAAWKVIKFPGPGKVIDGSWSGSATVDIGIANGAAQIESFAWAITPRNRVGEFEFPDDHSFVRQDKSSVVRTIATISSDASRARFSWCADSEMVRTHPNLLTQANAALGQVPLVATFADGSSVWCTSEKLTTTTIGSAPQVVPIAVPTAPWQYALNGREWIAWDDSTQVDREVTVEVTARGERVELGTLTLSRIGTKCTLKFLLNAALDPRARREAIESAQKTWRDAQTELTAASGDVTANAKARAVAAGTAELTAKESLAAARTDYESARVKARALDSWEVLVGSEQGIPTRITIRPPEFPELKGTTP
ncbi:MAG: hypothetical protein EXS17_07285 [Phycisphaerales bacterium]|nr:hypothetical protein [Phycisphaerales bacterium]